MSNMHVGKVCDQDAPEPSYQEFERTMSPSLFVSRRRDPGDSQAVVSQERKGAQNTRPTA